MSEVKENCKTLYIVTRVFTPKQNEKGNGSFREVYEVDRVRLPILWKILESSNNPKIKGEWRKNDESGINQEEWKQRLSLLNEKLIELEIILPGEE